MFVKTDGGRAEAGFLGKNDCAIRAIAIACDLDYRAARKLLKDFKRQGKTGNGVVHRGVPKDDITATLNSLGWVWMSAPKFEGRKARYTDIKGRVIVRMAKHVAAVIDGKLHDDWDSSAKMVYGYWKNPNA